MRDMKTQGRTTTNPAAMLSHRKNWKETKDKSFFPLVSSPVNSWSLTQSLSFFLFPPLSPSLPSCARAMGRGVYGKEPRNPTKGGTSYLPFLPLPLLTHKWLKCHQLLRPGAQTFVFTSRTREKRLQPFKALATVRLCGSLRM